MEAVKQRSYQMKITDRVSRDSVLVPIISDVVIDESTKIINSDLGNWLNNAFVNLVHFASVDDAGSRVAIYRNMLNAIRLVHRCDVLCDIIENGVSINRCKSEPKPLDKALDDASMCNTQITISVAIEQTNKTYNLTVPFGTQSVKVVKGYASNYAENGRQVIEFISILMYEYFNNAPTEWIEDDEYVTVFAIVMATLFDTRVQKSIVIKSKDDDVLFDQFYINEFDNGNWSFIPNKIHAQL